MRVGRALISIRRSRATNWKMLFRRPHKLLKSPTSPHLGDGPDFFIIIPLDSLYFLRRSPGSVCTPWLYASHAARHAEGRGDGREDRDGGLNDEAP